MRKVSFKFKKPYFRPILGPFTSFSEQNNFFLKKIQKKKPMIQFPENVWTDGRTNRTYFIEPFRFYWNEQIDKHIKATDLWKYQREV